MKGRVFRPRVRRRYRASHKHYPSCSPERGCYVETSKYWMKYYVRGKCYQQPCNTDNRAAAWRLLRERVTQYETAQLTALRPDLVLFGTLCDDLEKHYTRANNRSLKRAKQGLAHLKKFFGLDTRALDITRQWVVDYIDERLKVAGRGTVRYEVALLNTCFSVAVESGVLALRPEFKLPAAAEARTGFFSQADLAALFLELPGYLVPVVKFAAFVGWRHENVVGLTWDHIDWEGQTITLTPGETKGKFGIVFPFGAAPDLLSLLKDQWAKRNGPWVFHSNGTRVMRFDTTWRRACKRAGFPGRLFHDLRRTAARDMHRRGVGRPEIKRLCGWETDAMFDRYNIIDEDNLSQAVAKRFKGAEAGVS